VPQAGNEGRPLLSIEGTPPSLLDLPQGCSFSARCIHSIEVCRQQLPELVKLSEHQQVACHRHLHIQQRRQPEEV
jgi:oligopeptide/dipeptide ABC transporter ATP-binding protein